MEKYTSIHPYIEESLEFLFEKFKNKEQFEENEGFGFGASIGTYSLLLVGCCTYIESFLDFSLRKILFRVKHQKEDLEEFNKRIDRAPFKRAKKIFFELTNQEIEILINDVELSETIDNLFELRNGLVHGETIFFEIQKDSNIEFKRKYKELYDFLMRQNLIKKELKDGEHFIQKFISKEVAIFFYERSIKFVTKLDKGIFNLYSPLKDFEPNV